MGRPRKTLAAHIRDGTFAEARHGSLLTDLTDAEAERVLRGQPRLRAIRRNLLVTEAREASDEIPGAPVPEGWECPHVRIGEPCPFLQPLEGYVPPQYRRLWDEKVAKVRKDNTCLPQAPDLATT
jgi:hypothetical protein